MYRVSDDSFSTNKKNFSTEYLLKHQLELQERLRRESELSELLDATDYIDSEVLDGEEIRTIAGRSVSSNSNASSGDEDLIMHLVNAQENLNKLSDDNSETFSIRISNKDVNVVLQDDDGVEHQVPDLDLEIEIPKSKIRQGSTLRRRVRSLVRRLRGSNEVVIIKDTITVKDNNGKMYDLQMDLKVEVDEEELNRRERRSRSLRRQFVCPISVPWRKGGKAPEPPVETESSSSSDMSEGGDTASETSDCAKISEIKEAEISDCDGGKRTGTASSTMHRSTADLFRFTTV